ARSRVSTHPPLIRIARAGAVAPPGCCAEAVPPTVAATAETATAPAAVVQRNWRRDSDALHAPQEQDELPAKLRVMRSSPMLLLWPPCSLPSCGAARDGRTKGSAVGGCCPPRRGWNKKRAHAMHALLSGPIGWAATAASS